MAISTTKRPAPVASLMWKIMGAQTGGKRRLRERGGKEMEGDTSAAARVLMADSAHLLTHPVHDLQDEALGCEKKSMHEPCDREGGAI